MYMKNNKGQTLVVFILLLPLLVTLLAFIINEGSIYINKRALTNDIKNAIKYRFELEETDEIIYEKIEKYLQKNIDNINLLDIKIDENYIKINIETTFKAELPTIINKDRFTIKVTYTGYSNDGEVVIEKE